MTIFTPKWAVAAILAGVLTSQAGCQAEPPEGWTNPPSDGNDPARMDAAVERLDAWLVAHNPKVASSLQPGLDSAAATARAEAAGCPLPREVVELLQWHDGMPADTDLPVVWYHRFMSLEDAFERRRTYRGPALRALSPLPHDWLPLFEFQGEFFFTRCGARPIAPVWHWSGEEPEFRLVHESLADMLETTATAYERGALSMADPEEGITDMDVRRMHDVYVELNPGGTFPYRLPADGSE